MQPKKLAVHDLICKAASVGGEPFLCSLFDIPKEYSMILLLSSFESWSSSLKGTAEACGNTRLQARRK